MSESANVASLEAVCRFAVSVLRFQQDARLCMSAWDSQLRQVQFWLQRDRPAFWKNEIEKCAREVADARIRLHQCRMRRVGDFRPTCFEEQKDVEQAKRNFDFAQKQIPCVKHWNIAAQHEANEFHGRSGQLVQMLEREIPRLLALLKHSIDRLQSYADVSAPSASETTSRLTTLVAQLEQSLRASLEPQNSDLSVESGADERDMDPDGKFQEAPSASKDENSSAENSSSVVPDDSPPVEFSGEPTSENSDDMPH